MPVEPMPSSFLASKSRFSSAEMEWALRNGLIGSATVVEVARMGALDDMAEGEQHELAAVTHSELPSVTALLAGVKVDPAEEDRIRRKWTWLALSWLYEQRHTDETVF